MKFGIYNNEIGRGQLLNDERNIFLTREVWRRSAGHDALSKKVGKIALNLRGLLLEGVALGRQLLCLGRETWCELTEPVAGVFDVGCKRLERASVEYVSKAVDSGSSERVADLWLGRGHAL